MISPGETAPGALLPALTTAPGAGAGGDPTAYVTAIACGLLAALGATSVMVPVYTPGASPLGLTETTKFIPASPVVPPGGVTESQFPGCGEVTAVTAMKDKLPLDAAAVTV